METLYKSLGFPTLKTQWAIQDLFAPFTYLLSLDLCCLIRRYACIIFLHCSRRLQRADNVKYIELLNNEEFLPHNFKPQRHLGWKAHKLHKWNSLVACWELAFLTKDQRQLAGKVNRTGPAHIFPFIIAAIQLYTLTWMAPPSPKLPELGKKQGWP